MKKTLIIFSAACMSLGASAASVGNGASAEPTTVVMNDSVVLGPVLNESETMPAFEGGNIALTKFFARNMKYPLIAAECDVSARISVEFVVNVDGSVSDLKIASNQTTSPMEVKEDPNVNPDEIVTEYTQKKGKKQYLTTAEFNTSKKALEKEALRVVQSTSGKWTPGTQKGEPVRVKFTVPVNFRLM